MSLTKEYLNTIFDYKDGSLLWKIRKSNRCIIGDKAGTSHPNGYRYISVDSKTYAEHRLVYMYHFGECPKIIDHINRNKSDNRIENLRSATKQENCRNRDINNTNKSGIRNVCWHKQSKKWCVQLAIDGKCVTIGRFKDIELAELVAVEARNKYYKEFA